VIYLPLRKQDGSIRAYAVIDDEDANLALFRWRQHSGGYVQRSTPTAENNRNVYLHHAVLRLDAADTREVDHVNRDKLDNRRHNLRPAIRRASPSSTDDLAAYYDVPVSIIEAIHEAPTRLGARPAGLEVLCRYCGALIIEGYRNRRYCSDKHRDLYHYARRTERLADMPIHVGSSA
jgi:hypothetical protein